MIAQLSGTVAGLGANWAVVDVGGVGYKVACTPGTAAGLRPGETCRLATSLVVREDALSLYGFATEEERDTFEVLQLASGVGPRIALAVVAVLTPAQLVAAIRNDDINTLVKVPGIGRKGAQKMVLELHDRVLALGVVEPSAADLATRPAGSDAWREQVAAGLVSLGWSARDAEQACENVAHLAEADPSVSLGTLMKAALQSLARA